MRHALAFILLSSSLTLGAEVLPEWAAEIDLAAGNVNGKTALSFWPVADLQSLQLVPPETLEVRLVPHGRDDEEGSLPCGTWVTPPAGRYKYWLEGDGWMSASSAVLHYRASDFEGRGRPIIKTVVTAGRLALAPEVSVAEHQSLRLLHLDSHLREKVPALEMSRRVHGAAAKEGASMPEGPVLAALYDREKREYTALARPVSVYHGGLSYVDPQPPRADRSALIVVLERPAFAESFDDLTVEALLRTADGEPRRPAVVVPTVERLYAVFDNLEPGQVELTARSSGLFLPSQELILRPGKIESHRAVLRNLPDLEVTFLLPSELRKHELELSVERRDTRENVRRRGLGDDATELRLPDLPAAPLEVILEAKPWYFRQQIDLSDGEDRRIIFQPLPIQVDGRVWRGDEPYPTTVGFSSGAPRERGRAGVIEVETDEDGRFAVELYRPLFLVYIFSATAKEQTPFLEILPEPITHHATLDLHVPANAYSIRVLDAMSGETIPDAEVGAFNTYLDRQGEEGNASRKFTTDETGTATLTPLRLGKLSLRASAAGYRPSGEHVFEVRAEDRERELELHLQPAGEARSLSLLLPGGLPAAGAELIAVDDLEQGPIWRARSDTRGEVEIPDFLTGKLLLSKHPQAGFLIGVWETGPADETRIWNFPPSAPPLALRFHRGQPSDPAAWARPVLWVDGLPLSSSILRWLTDSGRVDGDGFFYAHHLPRRSLRAQAWMAGALNPEPNAALAVSIPYPWPKLVSIEALE